KIKLGHFLPVLAILALALVGASPAAAARGKPDYKAYGSCADGKPFKASRHCRYDRARLFRATFVFKSNVGKRPLKACFRVYGPKPLGGGHACAKLGPLAYKAYPFKIAGVRQRFSVKVTWFVKAKGDGFSPVVSSFMKVRP
ncbi:MAG TPA: hypothetical protein VEB65_10410, partial [Solirubrobacterales bacterium]|nr:hypothetical protein [Solirubrobacterales bacterium]